MKSIAESNQSGSFSNNYSEYIFYTVLFQTTVALYEYRLAELRSKVTSGLITYKRELGLKQCEPQHNTRLLKKEIAFLDTKVSSYVSMLQSALKDESKLRDMNLTVLARNNKNNSQDHPPSRGEEEDTSEAKVSTLWREKVFVCFIVRVMQIFM